MHIAFLGETPKEPTFGGEEMSIYYENKSVYVFGWLSGVVLLGATRGRTVAHALAPGTEGFRPTPNPSILVSAWTSGRRRGAR